MKVGRLVKAVGVDEAPQVVEDRMNEERTEVFDEKDCSPCDLGAYENVSAL